MLANLTVLMAIRRNVEATSLSPGDPAAQI
jgi:hypothetical protein